jgi:hypothetical protein
VTSTVEAVVLGERGCMSLGVALVLSRRSSQGSLDETRCGVVEEALRRFE